MIGIRIALGAEPCRIQALFLRRGLSVVAVGLVLGLGTAAAVTRLMQSLLFGVEPLNAVAFTAMPVVLAAAALLATWLPARHPLRVDPVETMRAE